MEGKLHTYHPSTHLLLFEFTPPTSPSTQNLSETSPNVLLFIGGLEDNFLNPGYVADIASLFPRSQTQPWTVMHVQLSTAMQGWGTLSIDRDIDEIAICINYIRNTIRVGKSTNIVLMGYSTGCQDILHYLHSPNPLTPTSTNRPPVQGAILQAPVSDREAILHAEFRHAPEARLMISKCVDLANKTPTSQHPTTLLPLPWTTPLYRSTPLSISRFISLLSPESPTTPSIEDLFSSDLPDTHLTSTFGQIAARNLIQPATPTHVPSSILILISDKDASMHESIDKNALLTRWKHAITAVSSDVTVNEMSMALADANHDISLKGEKGVWARLVVLRETVLRYLDGCGDKVDERAWELWREGKEKLEREGGGENEN